MTDKKKTFALRLDADIYASIEQWAADDLRSVNSQIEYLLREALRKQKRLKSRNSDNDK